MQFFAPPLPPVVKFWTRQIHSNLIIESREDLERLPRWRCEMFSTMHGHYCMPRCITQCAEKTRWQWNRLLNHVWDSNAIGLAYLGVQVVYWIYLTFEKPLLFIGSWRHNIQCVKKVIVYLNIYIFYLPRMVATVTIRIYTITHAHALYSQQEQINMKINLKFSVQQCIGTYEGAWNVSDAQAYAAQRVCSLFFTCGLYWCTVSHKNCQFLRATAIPAGTAESAY